MSAEIQPVRIFIAYSSKDLEFQRELKNHLEPLVRNKRIAVMDNYAINPGDNWDEKIGQMLEQTDIVLLLLSADALASPNFFKEAEIAIERRRQGRTDIIPIKLRPCDLEDELLLQELDLLEVLPEKDVPVVKWQHRDEAYVSIVKGLKTVLRVREEALIALEQRTQRQKEYSDWVGQADALMKKKNWSEAKGLLEKALAMWESGFEPKQEAVKNLHKQCTKEIETIENAERKKREQQETEKRKREEERRAREEAEKKRREAEEKRRFEEAEKRRKQEEAERLKKEQEHADKSAWEVAQKTNTAEAFAKYLKAHPSGLYAVQAYRFQQEMLETEAIAQKRREEEARKKREREGAEARSRQEAEKRQREEAERKRREDEEAPPAAPKRKRDYYEVLGVPKIAASDVIEKVYAEKKRAVSPGSEADLELQEAYRVLNNADLRGKYDRYGHAGVEGNYSTNAMNMDDIFRRFGFDIDQTAE